MMNPRYNCVSFISKKEKIKMNKFLVTMAVILSATSAFAEDLNPINLDFVQKKPVVNNTQGPFSPQSFFYQPVVNHKGQFAGVDLALLLDDYEENIAIVRPLESYKFLGITVDSVYATSFSPDGKKV